MKNIEVLGGGSFGYPSHIMCVKIKVKPTGKEFYLTGIRAQRFLKKWELFNDN